MQLKDVFRRPRLFVVAALLLVAVIAVPVWFRGESAERLTERAQLALSKSDYAEAIRLAEQALQKQPRLASALELAAKAEMQQGNAAAAASHFALIAQDDPAATADMFHAAGELALERGHATEAENYLQAALNRDPQHLSSRLLLAYLLAVMGRSRNAEELLMEAIRQGYGTIDHLSTLGLHRTLIDDAALVDRCLKAVPGDPLPLVARARVELAQGRLVEAERILRQVLAAHPQQPQALMRLGEALVHAPGSTFTDWLASLPPQTLDQPDVWVVRGLRAREQEQDEAAARCFWEALKRDPNLQVASYQLGQLLSLLGMAEKAKPVLERADRLVQLQEEIRLLEQKPNDIGLYRRVANHARRLGRLWESRGWLALARRLQPDLPPLNQELVDVQDELAADTPQTLAKANPALSLDLSAFPLPSERGKAPQDLSATDRSTGNGPSAIRFVDDAATAGVSFVYHNSADPDNRIMYLVEHTGGGVAVLDFDADAWPDLYFSQGRDWPPRAPQQTWLDRLFRNSGDGQFEDVTEPAGLGDADFSGGVAAADFDLDGWPDLYVVNVGSRRLYRNNGDGTFTDVTAAAGLEGGEWTTSCLIADLNGDTWPDIYDVNYVTRESAYRVCKSEDDFRDCRVVNSRAEQDRVHVSLGDGRFQDVSEEAGVIAPDGKGLGILAADFEGTGQLSLFVANDYTPNFFFVNETADRGGALRFAERAVLSGLAFDWDGLPQACMGVAAGDADGDGALDLFVTNFQDESNTLYLHRAPWFFVDATRPSGLREPGLPLLGFGTQFIDADLDGWPDLVAANGHVMNLAHRGIPFEMPPQFFRNLGAGRFEELRGEALGNYFQKKYLGRGLARLDWNRDGREDFAVSNSNAPASLVTNRTEPAGHFLALRFCGVASDRDAIGATVRLTCGPRTWVHQLTAGDGFQASNQRQIVAGLGACTQIDRLTVRWPSRLEQSFASPPVDSELLLIEGRDAPVRLIKPESAQ